MRASSAATSTGPTSASIARRQTWTIIGSPQMSASGLPGSRVELMRGGAGKIGLAMAAMKNAPKNWVRRRAYTCCQDRRKAANQDSPWGRRAPAADFDSGALIANGNDQRQQNRARSARRLAWNDGPRCLQ